MGKLKLLSATVLAITLSGCSTISVDRSQMEADKKAVEQQRENHEIKGRTELELNGQSLRIQTIENSYYTYHFQKSVYQQYKDLIGLLEPMSSTLNEIFNFGQLMYNGKMLPPVIEEAHDYLGLQDERSLVQTERRWRIIRDARVVATLPVWQDYMFAGFNEIELSRLNPVLKPRNEEERRAAERARARADIESKDYVVTLFNTNLSRLAKDYQGMLTYKMLEVQGIVQPPVLAVSNEPFIYTNNNKEVSIGTSRYVITYDSQFSNYKNWRPIVSTGQIINDRDTVFTPPAYPSRGR